MQVTTIELYESVFLCIRRNKGRIARVLFVLLDSYVMLFLHGILLRALELTHISSYVLAIICVQYL